MHESNRPHRRARPALHLERERHEELPGRQLVQVLQVLHDVGLVSEQGVVCRVLFRAEGVDGEGVATHERNPLLDQILRRIPPEARPVLEEAHTCRAKTPPPVPTVADEDPVSLLYLAVLLLPLPYVRGGEEATGREFGSLNRRGASGKAAKGYLVYAVVGRAFGDEVQGGVHVGAGMLAQRQTVVACNGTELVGLVEDLAEPGMCGPGRYALFQRVAQVNPPRILQLLRQRQQAFFVQHIAPLATSENPRLRQ